MILIGLVVPTARGSQVLADRARADAKAWTVTKLRVRLFKSLNHPPVVPHSGRNPGDKTSCYSPVCSTLDRPPRIRGSLAALWQPTL